MATPKRNLTGKKLNEIWGVGAKHALYREDGKWYHQLYRFPGALFDADGYVIFRTEEEYLNSPYLQVQQDLHVPNGIASIPGYVRVTSKAGLQAFSQQLIEVREQQSQDRPKKEESLLRALDMPISDGEAERVLMETARIIRDTKIAKQVKTLHEYKCQICGDALEMGNGICYAESHHLKPLGGDHKGPDVVENILCLCPNHHAQLDFGAIKLSIASLRSVPGHQIGDEYIRYHNSVILRNAG